MPSLLERVFAPLEWVASKLGTSAKVERRPEEQARDIIAWLRQRLVAEPNA